MSESESDGGFVEFGDVDFGVSGLDGVWHPGGLWNPSRGVCADAPAAEAGGGEDAAGSSAGVVTELPVFARVLVQARMESTGASWERLQMVLSGLFCWWLSFEDQVPIP
ncbi:MAG: hypothetical protein ACLQKA_09980 [Bryobacteraceae bacterium]